MRTCSLPCLMAPRAPRVGATWRVDPEDLADYELRVAGYRGSLRDLANSRVLCYLSAVSRAGHERLTARPAPPQRSTLGLAWRRNAAPRAGSFWTHVSVLTPPFPDEPRTEVPGIVERSVLSKLPLRTGLVTQMVLYINDIDRRRSLRPGLCVLVLRPTSHQSFASGPSLVFSVSERE